MHHCLEGVAKSAVQVLRDWDNLYSRKLKHKCGYLTRWETEYDNQPLMIFCALCQRYQTTGIRGENAFIAGTELWSVGGARRLHTQPVGASLGDDSDSSDT